jgi:hypothetical protein
LLVAALVRETTLYGMGEWGYSELSDGDQMLPEKDTMVYTRATDKVVVVVDQYFYTEDTIPRGVDELIEDLQKIREEGNSVVRLSSVPDQFSDERSPLLEISLYREPTPEELIEEKRKGEEEDQKLREWQLRQLEALKAQIGLDGVKEALGL